MNMSTNYSYTSTYLKLSD